MRLLKYFALLLLACLFNAPVAAAPNCSGDELIIETFNNGARWEMCWESRIRENLVLSDVYYTPPQGQSKRVLGTARLSQLHVAYDDSDVTYNDITQYGLGGGYLIELNETDCPFGDLLLVQTRPAICKWRSQASDTYRTASRTATAESLTLFSVSQVGAYAYIVTWKFYSDGAIEPQIGATGALQRNSAALELPFGRLLQGDQDTLWLSHTHNYYWRLDFDIGDNAVDDVVTESRTSLLANGTRETVTERFNIEQSRMINPDTPLAWDIWENLSGPLPGPGDTGYRIEPLRFGHRLVRAENEPYTEFDFFVTVANECERFASQNARFNPDCLNHVAQFANDESLVDADLVVWHRVSFHHVPRSEDQRHMHTHWDGFVIEPINVHVSTPGVNVNVNNAPELTSIDDRTDAMDATVNLQLQASDADGDRLRFSAINLPPGLSIDTAGTISGKVSTAGVYDVEINVTDDLTDEHAHFTWRVGVNDDNSKGGFGSVGFYSLCVLLLTIVRRRTVFKHN